MIRITDGMSSLLRRKRNRFMRRHYQSDKTRGAIAFELVRAGASLRSLMRHPGAPLLREYGGSLKRGQFSRALGRIENALDITPVTDNSADITMLSNGSLQSFNDMVSYAKANTGYSDRMTQIYANEFYDAHGIDFQNQAA